MRFLWEHKWIMLMVLALLAALALTVASLLHPGQALGVSALLDGMLRPVQAATSAFGSWLSSLGGDGEQIDELLAENQRLRQHAAQVEEQARLYEQTLEENQRLRTLLEFKQRRSDFTFEPATVMSKDLDNYARAYTLSKGSRHGVETGMMAVNESLQLVGIVSEVGVSQSTLRTLVDADFVCGAYVYRPGLDGVCQGRFAYMNSYQTTLVGLTPDMDVRIGDKVLTSGGLYPRDVDIGTVSELIFDPNGMTATAIITPTVDLKHIEQVFLVVAFDSEE